MGKPKKDFETECVSGESTQLPSPRIGPLKSTLQEVVKDMCMLEMEDPEYTSDSSVSRSTSEPSLNGACAAEEDEDDGTRIGPEVHDESRKSVKFSEIEIRLYSRVIGDHPCCAVGCPLSLGWEYDAENTIVSAVDDFEASRAGERRTRQQLKTSCDRRLELLAEHESEEEIKRATRKLHRARACNYKLSERANESFFAASRSTTATSTTQSNDDEEGEEFFC